jgi:UDP-glucose 4-epimerase
MKNKNFIILGGNGYIGTALKNKLKENFISISRNNNNKNNNTYSCNFFSDLSWTKFIKKNTCIFFLGFENDLYKFEKDSAKITEEYNDFCLKFYKYIVNKKKLNLRIIFTSTVSIYGIKEHKITEKNLTNPLTWYDYNKVSIENFFLYLTRIKLIKFTSLRLSNVYGGDYESSQNNRGFINKLLNKNKKKQKIKVFEEGKYYRDYIYINDVINALIAAKNKINKINGKVYNVCSGKSYKIIDIIKLIIKKIKTRNMQLVNTKLPKKINKIETRNFRGSSKLFQKETGWSPKYSIEKGLEESIKK